MMANHLTIDLKDFQSYVDLREVLEHMRRVVGDHGLDYTFIAPANEFLDFLRELRSDCCPQSLHVMSDMHQDECWWCFFIDAVQGYQDVEVIAVWHPEADKKFWDKLFILTTHNIKVSVQPE
jgi:hypothetical protein